ncbi:MAG: acyl-CoA dehydrogenase family protein [Xanthobacteraceae bacterium]
MTVVTQTSSVKTPRRSLVDVAKEFHPLFAGQAAANEAKGSLTDETIRALWDGGFFGMWIPRSFGGIEAGPLEALGTVEQLCYSDGSTGWVFMAAQVAMGSAAAYLPASTAKELFGNSKWPVIAGQGGANGNGMVEGNGFRLTGKWAYGSGLLHSSWLHSGGNIIANGAPRMLPGGKYPEVRIFITPTKDATIKGNWDVMGLRATGSVDYHIDGLFVPEEYTHWQGANTPVQGGAIFTLAIFGISAIGHSGFALGVGRRVLDELRALATAETGRPQTLPVRGGGESFLEQYGRAEASYRACRALIYDCWGDIEATLDRGDRASTRQITLARVALNYATTAVAEICAFAYRYGGGVALRDSVLQRYFRDMNAGTQHASVSTGILRLCATDLLGMAEGRVWTGRALIEP